MRHRFLFPLSLSLAAAFVVAGCGQDTTAPTPSAASTLADDAGGGLSANAGNPVVFLARGSMHKEGQLVGGAPTDEWLTFTFTAEQRQDGTTTGQVLQDRKNEQRQHGRVFCMADLGSGFVGIGAEGLKRTPENQPPNPLGGFGVPDAVRPDNHGIFFVVRDNGEGANAPPDQFTGFVQTTLGFAAGICALGQNHPLVALLPACLNDADAGNIQVTFP